MSTFSSPLEYIFYMFMKNKTVNFYLMKIECGEVTAWYRYQKLFIKGNNNLVKENLYIKY